MTLAYLRKRSDQPEKNFRVRARPGASRHIETRPVCPDRTHPLYVTSMAFELSEGPAFAYIQVADHIAGRIRSGELAPGARLPAERGLAAEYGVSLGTARKAVRVLQDRSLVVIAPSKGVFISKKRDP